MYTGLAAPLAHQGGWDEILRIAAPIAVVWFTISFLNRRMTAADAIDNQDDAPGGRARAVTHDREDGTAAPVAPQEELAQLSKAGTGPALSQSAKNAPRS